MSGVSVIGVPIISRVDHLHRRREIRIAPHFARRRRDGISYVETPNASNALTNGYRAKFRAAADVPGLRRAGVVVGNRSVAEHQLLRPRCARN